ncbi:MAG: hypothetical protein ACWA5P_02825 [bacterium]
MDTGSIMANQMDDLIEQGLKIKDQLEEDFSNWWEGQTKEGKWTTLERMAAHDAWMDSYKKYNSTNL